MMRLLRLLAWSFMSAALVIAALGGAGYWLYTEAQRPGPLTQTRTVVVPARSGLSGIAHLLADNGVVRYPLAFELIARLSGRSTALKPGEYDIPAGASTLQTLDLLASGRTVKHRLTVPEGLTSAEVIALVRKAPALAGDVGPVPPDGSLLPDTYLYGYGDSRMDLIERMRRDMTRLVARLWQKHRSGVPLATAEQAIILASIVEKETAREEERPHVAGVYVNRLRLGMPLQADPTVLYAMSPDNPTLGRPLDHADLAVASPYNTYLHKGLPPGPIDNPSQSSLRAAMQPETTQDLYFVADGSGGHQFAKTLAEQNHNVAQYRRGTALEPDVLPPIAPPDPPSPPLGAAGHPGVVEPAATHHHPLRQAARLPRCRHEPGHHCVR